MHWSSWRAGGARYTRSPKERLNASRSAGVMVSRSISPKEKKAMCFSPSNNSVHVAATGASSPLPPPPSPPVGQLPSSWLPCRKSSCSATHPTRAPATPPLRRLWARPSSRKPTIWPISGGMLPTSPVRSRRSAFKREQPTTRTLTPLSRGGGSNTLRSSCPSKTAAPAGCCVVAPSRSSASSGQASSCNKDESAVSAVSSTAERRQFSWRVWPCAAIVTTSLVSAPSYR
mmetsp:Transcript_63789/g.142282  ORF Transcript_63789/g.142282 Transcript_63789/m.142282 type:complete len:230 (-) Transcript_63789:190-879(-)